MTNYTGHLTIYRYDNVDDFVLETRRDRLRYWLNDWQYRLLHAWDALKGVDCYDD